jgi:hypothetical protein
MAVGQAVLTSALDVGALNAVETRLEVQGVAVCQAHAVLLREVLELHRVLTAAGAGLSTVPQAALLLQVSEQAAQQLLAEGQLLFWLPGGLEALECGLLTVGQSAAFLRAVGDLDRQVQQAVWVQLQARLLSAAQEGVVLPPARLAPLLAKWVVQADPADAQDHRRQAEAHGDVSYRRREDGLGDLFATAIPAPLLQAVLCRIRAAAQPFGSQDDRTAGKRRLDALLDLLLGRQQLRLDDTAEPAPPAPPCTTAGCRPGSPAPCGADVLIHVPLGAALGTTDELADLVGHGPLHPDQLEAVLTSSPRMRVVRVDADGVPVSVDDQVHVPPRGDLDAVRLLIRTMAAGPPGQAQPRHPFDHPHDPGDLPPDDSRCEAASGPSPGGRPRVRPGGHPREESGPYRLPRRLRRLVQVRAPRCEWPGCGVRAQACDIDHDRAWPAGATCAFNTGPLCRRHHRVKQLLMTKTRSQGSAVVWTGPTGRSWTSPAQRTAPAPPVRPQPMTPVEGHSLSPDALDELLAGPDTDPVQYELRSLEDEPADVDGLGERICDDDGWGLALDDPYRWTA